MSFKLKLVKLEDMKCKYGSKFFEEHRYMRFKYVLTRQNEDSFKEYWDYKILHIFNNDFTIYPIFGSVKTFDSLRELRLFLSKEQLKDNKKQIQKCKKSIINLKKAIKKVKELEEGVSK